MHFFILCISIVGVRVYTETECGVFASMLQCFHQCSTCVKLLSPSSFVSCVLIGICAMWNGTYYLNLKSRQATKYSRFHQDTKVGGVWWFWTQHDAHWNAHYMNNTRDHYTYISLCGYLLGNRQPSPEAHLHCCRIFSCTLVSGSS